MQLLDRPGFLRLMRAAFWIALLGSVVLAIIPQPPDLGTSGFGDKFNHILAFATLTVLACLGFPNAERLRIAERLSFLGAMIEVVQALAVLGRDCDIRDWMADTVAIALALLLMHFLLPRLRRVREP